MVSRYEITRYEIVATHTDGRQWLIGYSPRVSRIGLLRAMQRVGPQMIERLGITDDGVVTWGTRPWAHCFMDGWRIGFTERTQRDCHMSGALPFVAA
jgi:hypothetical protein